MYSPFSLLHQHMGSLLDAFEHEAFPAHSHGSYGQRGYRGYRRQQPDLYRSLYEPSPSYYVQPQPYLHLIDVSLPVAEPEQEQQELSVEEQLRAQLAQQKASAVQSNDKQQPPQQQAQPSSAMTTASNNSQQQMAAPRNESPEQDPLNSLFRSLFRPSSAQSLVSTTLPAELQPLQKLRVDVSEDDSGMTVQAEIAGLSKEDVQLTVKDHVLTIAASKQSQREQHAADAEAKQQSAAAAAGKEPAEQKVKEAADDKPAAEQAKSPQPQTSSNTTTGSRVLHRELYSGRVSRSLRLPRQADLSAISASCKDGLLTLRVPYKQSQEPEQRTIAIN